MYRAVMGTASVTCGVCWVRFLGGAVGRVFNGIIGSLVLNDAPGF